MAKPLTAIPKSDRVFLAGRARYLASQLNELALVMEAEEPTMSVRTAFDSLCDVSQRAEILAADVQHYDDDTA